MDCPQQLYHNVFDNLLQILLVDGYTHGDINNTIRSHLHIHRNNCLTYTASCPYIYLHSAFDTAIVILLQLGTSMDHIETLLHSSFHTINCTFGAIVTLPSNPSLPPLQFQPPPAPLLPQLEELLAVSSPSVSPANSPRSSPEPSPPQTSPPSTGKNI